MAFFPHKSNQARRRPRARAERCEMYEMWRWLSGKQPSRWARLMCSQWTDTDPSSNSSSRLCWLWRGPALSADLYRPASAPPPRATTGRSARRFHPCTCARVRDTCCCWGGGRCCHETLLDLEVMWNPTTICELIGCSLLLHNYYYFYIFIYFIFFL